MIGAVAGVAVTYLYAARQGWSVNMPLSVLAGAVGLAMMLGVVAGLYPAARAALMHPADAVRPAA